MEEMLEKEIQDERDLGHDLIMRDQMIVDLKSEIDNLRSIVKQLKEQLEE